MEIKTKTRKMGNNMGIIIPEKIVRYYNIKPDQEITLILNNDSIRKDILVEIQVKN